MLDRSAGSSIWLEAVKSLSRAIDNHELPFECAKCGHHFRERIGYLKTNPDIRCPGCGIMISVEADRLQAGIKKHIKALEDSRRKIRKLFK